MALLFASFGALETLLSGIARTGASASTANAGCPQSIARPAETEAVGLQVILASSGIL